MKLSLTILEPRTLVDMTLTGQVKVYSNPRGLDVMSDGCINHHIGLGHCWCKFRLDKGKKKKIIIHDSKVDVKAAIV